MQGPGASDDAVSCAVMLEILEVLTTSPTPLRHGLIFLFNDGEEAFMLGSEQFVRHKWADDG